jgi:hypothetical protein
VASQQELRHLSFMALQRTLLHRWNRDVSRIRLVRIER